MHESWLISSSAQFVSSVLLSSAAHHESATTMMMVVSDAPLFLSSLSSTSASHCLLSLISEGVYRSSIVGCKTKLVEPRKHRGVMQIAVMTVAVNKQLLRLNTTLSDSTEERCNGRQVVGPSSLSQINWFKC